MGHQLLQIRTATIQDAPLILSYIHELAEYEDLAQQVVARKEDIEETLFSDKPQAYCALAEWRGQPCGIAIYFFNYSTFRGRHGLYLEDLYVRPNFRDLGIGFRLLQHLAQIAKKENCHRLEWAVLKNNTRAIAFYDRLGAKPQNEWVTYRLDTNGIETLSAAPQPEKSLQEIIENAIV